MRRLKRYPLHPSYEMSCCGNRHHAATTIARVFRGHYVYQTEHARRVEHHRYLATRAAVSITDLNQPSSLTLDLSSLHIMTAPLLSPPFHQAIKRLEPYLITYILKIRIKKMNTVDWAVR